MQPCGLESQSSQETLFSCLASADLANLRRRCMERCRRRRWRWKPSSTWSSNRLASRWCSVGNAAWCRWQVHQMASLCASVGQQGCQRTPFPSGLWNNRCSSTMPVMWEARRWGGGGGPKIKQQQNSQEQPAAKKETRYKQMQEPWHKAASWKLNNNKTSRTTHS